MDDDRFPVPGDQSVPILLLAEQLRKGDTVQQQEAAVRLWRLARGGWFRKVLASGALARMVLVGSRGRWELDEPGVRELARMSEKDALEVLEQMMMPEPPRNSFRELLHGALLKGMISENSCSREEPELPSPGRKEEEEAPVPDCLEEEINPGGGEERKPGFFRRLPLLLFIKTLMFVLWLFGSQAQEKSPDLNK